MVINKFHSEQDAGHLPDWFSFHDSAYEVTNSDIFDNFGHFTHSYHGNVAIWIRDQVCGVLKQQCVWWDWIYLNSNRTFRLSTLAAAVPTVNFCNSIEWWDIFKNEHKNSSFWRNLNQQYLSENIQRISSSCWTNCLQLELIKRRQRVNSFDALESFWNCI